MNLEQQIRRYGEQVEAEAIAVGEAAAQPDANEQDLDVALAPIAARPSGRARVLVLCAAALVLVVGIAAVALRPSTETVKAVGPDVDGPTAASEPPAEPDAPVSLWLSATRVPPGPSEIVAVLVNHGGPDAMFGVAAQVERWDGEAWVPHRQLTVCLDHWSCVAELHPIEEQQDVPGIGLPATVEQPGPVERFTTDGLDVGWYRLSQTANEGVVAAAIFEVAADAVTPPPLWPVDQHAISVSPPIVAPGGATVRLSPLVPDTKTAEDIEAAVAGLSETAAVERWDGGSWVEVATVELVPVTIPGATTYRTATLPPLEAGSYQLVRTGPLGPQVGSFWVVDADPPSTDTTEPTFDSLPVVASEPESHGWPAGAGEQALISGVLWIGLDGCTEIGGIRAAWPSGTVIDEGGSQLRLTDGRVYVAGSELEMGGGHHRSDELPSPDRCEGDEVVFVW